jgi:small ligand-binding sensory domain FIST
MRWGSTISQHPETELATLDAAAAARLVLGDVPVDLAFVFLSPQHIARAGGVLEVLAERFPGAVLVGCSAQSCIGGGVEVEEGPSLSLTLAHMPDVSLHPFHVAPEALAQAAQGTGQRLDITGVRPDDEPGFILLGDPSTGDTEALIRGLEVAYPGAVQIGGLASGARQPGGDVLLLQDRVLSQGYVGLALAGNVVIDTVVAQGCRPIGQPMFVTRSEKNLIFEIDGRPPLEVLNELAAEASERELLLLQTSLFIGVQMNPERVELGRGDFLVRNVLGTDRDTGALAIGTLVEDTQVVQFQIRDGETAAEDVSLGLSQHRDNHPEAASALLFSCLGRGRGMYGVENYDSDAFRRIAGDVSVSGFFCNGEIGPVEGRTFLHGYTSAFGIFRPKAPPGPPTSTR